MKLMFCLLILIMAIFCEARGRIEPRCRLHSDPGECNGINHMYTYNNRRGRCEPFMYGGCMGNDNRFYTLQECQAACYIDDNFIQRPFDSPRPFDSSRPIDSPRPFDIARPRPQPGSEPRCLQPVDPGECNGINHMFTYNYRQDRCVPFIYSGCRGNDNRFYTLEECQAACVERPLNLPPRRRPEPRCLEPTTAGNCMAIYHKFTYNDARGRCEPFIYGGCWGNNNRFDTLQECQAACPSMTT